MSNLKSFMMQVGIFEEGSFVAFIIRIIPAVASVAGMLGVISGEISSKWLAFCFTMALLTVAVDLLLVKSKDTSNNGNREDLSDEVG